MEKILIIYNPISGRQRRIPAWEKIKRFLPSSTYAIDTFNIQEQPLQESREFMNYSTIVVVGGDGTLRTVIAYLQYKQLDIPIALIPRGSANLIAKSLRLPRSVKKTARLIKRGATTALDIARIGVDHYFIGAFAMGYLSNRITATQQSTKRRLGFLGYIVSFIQQTRLPLHSFHCTVDDTTVQLSGHSLFIVNTANIFGLAGRHIRSYRDGLFELVVTTNKSFFSLCGLIFDFYFRRRDPRHFILIRGSSFTIDSPGALILQIDGERYTGSTPVKIVVISKKQRFIIS